MHTVKSVEHTGTVDAIVNGVVKVNILSQSACSSCHAKGACSVADMENKIIDVQTSDNQYKIGEKVKVVMQQSQGFKALLLGYVLPFVLVITFLIIGTGAELSEGKAGLIALAALPIYYLGLYLSNKKLKQTFSFRIQKLN